MLGSSKAVNAACLAVFDPSTNSALSRQLESAKKKIDLGGFHPACLICYPHHPHHRSKAVHISRKLCSSDRCSSEAPIQGVLEWPNDGSDYSVGRQQLLVTVSTCGVSMMIVRAVRHTTNSAVGDGERAPRGDRPERFLIGCRRARRGRHHCCPSHKVPKRAGYKRPGRPPTNAPYKIY